MGFFRNLSIKYKLVLFGLSIGLGSLALIGWLGVKTSSQSLLAQQEQSLEAIRTARKKQIEDYFGFIHEQIFNFGQNRMVTEATAKFSQAFQDVVAQTKLDASDGGAVYNAVKGYYTGEFKPRLADAGQPWRGDETYVPASAAGRILQAFYIANNPNAVGEKLNLDRSPEACDYNRLHAVYHPRIRDFLNSFGYYDIFLFDLKGNMVYSVFKETDYATNFLDGPYKDTNFGDVYRKCLASDEPGAVFIDDFKYYEPSYGAPASFTGSPVFHDGEKVGVAIFQMPVDKITEIMQNAAGMGETGETYLVGHDRRMRSNSRFSEETTILTQEIITDATQAATAGKTGMGIIDDYRGIPVVSSYSPLELEGLSWVILAEMDFAEVTAPAKALQNRILFAAAITAAIVAVVALLFSVVLVRPIPPLVKRANQIAKGDLTGKELPVRSHDELGQLTQSINEMSQSLSEVVTEVTRAANEVASTASEIAASSDEMTRGMGEQNSQVQQASAAIEQMSASIIEVARKSNDAATNAGKSGEAAQQGGQVVNETIKGMKSINDAVSAGAASVSELGKRGEQIGQIIEVINDIADQTNLLALNAAIEAARAGEHGRGFAVVADEVRKLADRTTKATAEVAESIKAIQTETVEAVKRMEAGTDQVQAGVVSATKAGQSLEQIVSNARDVAGMIQSIAAAAEQQSSASEEVARSIASIQNIAEVAEVGATQSSQAVGNLAERASLLMNMISRFTTSTSKQRLGKWLPKPTDPTRILIVDDDPSIVRLLENHLKAFGECTTAANGQAALAAYRSKLDQHQRFDLVCLDIKMPDMDGRKVLAQFREMEKAGGMTERLRARVIMTTGVDTPNDKLQAFRHACDAYLVKPIDKSQLLETIKKLGITSKNPVAANA